MYFLALLLTAFSIFAEGQMTLAAGSNYRGDLYAASMPIEYFSNKSPFSIGLKPFAIFNKDRRFWGVDSILKISSPVYKNFQFFISTGFDFIYTLGLTGALIFDMILNAGCGLDNNSNSNCGRSLALEPFFKRASFRSFNLAAGMSIVLKKIIITPQIVMQGYGNAGINNYLTYASIEVGFRF